MFYSPEKKPSSSSSCSNRIVVAVVVVVVMVMMMMMMMMMMMIIALKGAIREFYNFLTVYRLGGLVVKASTSRAEDPGFESPLASGFLWVESYQ